MCLCGLGLGLGPIAGPVLKVDGLLRWVVCRMFFGHQPLCTVLRWAQHPEVGQRGRAAWGSVYLGHGMAVQIHKMLAHLGVDGREVQMVSNGWTT
jgi:hypothetical protein